MGNDVLRGLLGRGLMAGMGKLVLGSVPASADASLVESDPSDGAAAAPTTITLTFSEDVGDPAFVLVRAADGTKVTTSKIRALDNVVTTTVADVSEKGRFGASYRVVPADGQPHRGHVQLQRHHRSHRQPGRRTRHADIPPPASRSFLLGHSCGSRRSRAPTRIPEGAR